MMNNSKILLKYFRMFLIKTKFKNPKSKKHKHIYTSTLTIFLKSSFIVILKQIHNNFGIDIVKHKALIQ